MCIRLIEIRVANVKSIKDMWKNCSLKIRQFELESGAVICEHNNTWHTLYYKPKSLIDLCVNHYIKRYIKDNNTELTQVPNWPMLIRGRYEEELYFVMLLCKENVGK